MATKLLNREPIVDNIRQFGLFDDFFDLATGVVWTVTADPSGAAAIDADAPVGGLIELASTALNDDGVYVLSLEECFKVATDKPLMALMRAKLVATTNENNAEMMFGFMDGVGASSILDGGGPAADKYLAVFDKTGGASTLAVKSTSTAAGVYNSSTTDITADQGWSTYMIVVEPLSSTDKRITFYYDPDGGQNFEQCRDSDGNLIQQKWSTADTAAGTGELNLFVGIKNTSAEVSTLTVDYLGAWQLR